MKWLVRGLQLAFERLADDEAVEARQVTVFHRKKTRGH